MNTQKAPVKILEDVVSMREYAEDTLLSAKMRDSFYLYNRADEANRKALANLKELMGTLEAMAAEIESDISCIAAELSI